MADDFTINVHETDAQGMHFETLHADTKEKLYKKVERFLQGGVRFIDDIDDASDFKKWHDAHTK